MLSAQLLALVSLLALCCASEWGYHSSNGPANWKNIVPDSQCDGSKQSPINIQGSQTRYRDMPPLNVSKYTVRQPMNISNNGNTLTAIISGRRGAIWGGSLQGRYMLENYHFHWGADSTKGSEHSLNGRHFPLELHLVHYSEQYADLEEAVTKPRGLAVLSFFFRETAKNNTSIILREILSLIPRVKLKGDAHAMSGYHLHTLVPSSLSEFYHYEGSLTTPPCAETVLWHVFKEPLFISAKQLAVFRTLRTGVSESTDVLADNFRPKQPLNNRVVYRSFSSEDSEDSEDNSDAAPRSQAQLSPLILVSVSARLLWE